jgi:integrase
MRLRQADVARLASDPARSIVHWDDDVPAFGVRVHPSGRRVYVVRVRIKRKTVWITLGADGVVSLAMAREQARKILAEASLTGEDPRKARARGVTFGVVAQTYLDEHAKKKKTGAEDAWKLRKYLQPWRSVPILDITRADIAQLHAKISKVYPIAANRVLSLLSKIWNWAEEFGLVPEGTPNPCRRIRKNRETSRSRFVSREEMPRLLEAIAAEKDPWARGALLLYVLIGGRKHEILNLKWADVDLEREELVFRNTKSGRDHTLPLSRAAVDLLRSIPTQKGFEDFVFPGLRGPRKDIRRQWERVKIAANLPDLTIHDLRRTLGSWLAASGRSLHLIGAILNHRNQQTTSIYARFQQGNLREALEEHARLLEEFQPKG